MSLTLPPLLGRAVLVLLASSWAAVSAGAEITIDVDGLADTLKEKVVPELALQQARAPEYQGSARDIRHLYDQSRQQLINALRTFGFYRARVVGKLARTEETWQVRFDVTPGQAIRYAAVTVEFTDAAADDDVLRRSLEAFPIRTGDVLEHERYETAKQDLLRAALDRGYLDAELQRHRIEVDLARYEARLELIIASGPLYRFGKIRLLQEDLDPEFLRNYVPFQTGDRYSTQQLLELKNALRDSDYFETVNVTPRPDESRDGQLPIDVVLTPRKNNKYTFGLGFGTDTGVRGSAAWERRRLNRRGHRLLSELRLSQIDKSLEGQYRIPLADPRNDQMIVAAGYRDEDPDTSDSRIGHLGITRSVLRGRTRVDYFLRYQHEDFTVANEGSVVDMLIPGVKLSRVAADDRLNTRRGMRVSLNLQGSPDVLFFDVRHLQADLAGKLILPLGSRGRFITRGRIAATAAPSLEELPASLRFFTGGDQSVRGFSYQELGPVDDEGEVTGGRHLLVGSVELDYQVGGNWRLAVFTDTGNAFDDFDEPLARSSGFGLRYQTPVGPLRVDLANAWSEPSNPWRLHISIGPDL